MMVNDDKRKALAEAPGPVAGPARVVELTDWERQVLQYLAAGYTNAQIAQRLFRSEKTVRNRLSVLYQKLGVANRAGAVGATI
jgi:DNA-binding NarL/FixJ family response regulator